MYQLLIHYWKEKIRSSFWQKSIFINILLGIIGIYLSLNLLALSFFADKILESIFPNQAVLLTFNRLLFYYFLVDIVIRFFLQQLPVISIQPYLNLPIKKKVLLHFPLLRSIFSFFNFAALFLVLPFFIKVILPTESLTYCTFWIVTVLSLIFFNNFLNFGLKKYFSKQPLFIILCIVLLIVVFYLDYSNIISISSNFAAYFINFSQELIVLVIPIIGLIAAYIFAYILLKKNSYIEDSTSRESSVSINKFQFLSNYGLIGNLIGTEIKLILRNKRPKAALYMSIFFLFYGFIFYNDTYLGNLYMLSFVGIFLTSTIAMFYYQFAFSWESSFYDTYLTHKISINNFVASKYYLFAVMCITSYLLTLPYAFIDYRIAFINTAMLLYNIGIASIILFYFGTYSNSFIDLGNGQLMNYQGTGAHHFLMMIPLIGIPMLIILPFDLLDIENYGILAVGILGTLAIIFHKNLVGFIGNQLIKRKYRMACGFRQK